MEKCAIVDEAVTNMKSMCPGKTCSGKKMRKHNLKKREWTEHEKQKI